MKDNPYPTTIVLSRYAGVKNRDCMERHAILINHITVKEYTVMGSGKMSKAEIDFHNESKLRKSENLTGFNSGGDETYTERVEREMVQNVKILLESYKKKTIEKVVHRQKVALIKEWFRDFDDNEKLALLHELFQRKSSEQTVPKHSLLNF